MRFCCCFGRNSISCGMYRRMSSRMAAARHSDASQNLPISSLGSLLLTCSGVLSKMSANETDIGMCSLSNNRSFIAFLRLPVSSNASISNTMACGKVSFFLFGHIGLSLKSCSQHLISSKPSSRIALLLSNVLANYISCVSPLLPCFVFRKRPLPCAVLENTLDSHANGSHGTETPRLFPNKNHPLDILLVRSPP